MPQAEDLLDSVAMTLNELGPLKFTDLISNYQHTIAFKRLIKKKKTTFQGGSEIEFRVIFDHNNSARFVQPGFTAVVDIPSIMTVGKIPWRHITWNWGLERKFLAMNRGAHRIFEYAKAQRIAGTAAAVLEMERAFWRSPSTTSDDAFGVPHYVVKSNTATTTNEGFNGNLPSGWSTVANLSTTTLPKWKNYATQYTAMTKTDLVRKMRRAMQFTNFEPIVEGSPVYDVGNDYGCYTNYSVVGTLEELLEEQNDNLGNDIAPMDGRLVFRRVPMTWVKELESDTTNPIYGLNWSSMEVVALADEWLKEDKFDKLEAQPTVAATHITCTYNLICRNRRRNWVLATDTTMPA